MKDKKKGKMENMRWLWFGGGFITHMVLKDLFSERSSKPSRMMHRFEDAEARILKLEALYYQLVKAVKDGK